MRTCDLAVRPAHFNHKLAAMLEVSKPDDCFLECIGAFHELSMRQIARYVKYVITERTQSHNRTSKLKLTRTTEPLVPFQFICGLMKNMELNAIRLEVPSDGNIIV